MMSLTKAVARPRRIFLAGGEARRLTLPSATDLVTSPWFVAGAATLFGLWAMALYMRAGLLLVQGDSVAHLDTARGVSDSLTPSFAQLGGVWLPLPHVLMLPLIWIDPLWRSGLAGSLPSVFAFALSAVYLQKLALLLTNNRAASLVAVAIFATNPNMLFMQATPMTESLTVFFIIASSYHLIRFARAQSFLHLLLNAGFIAAATVTRYETWILIPATGVVVLVSTYMHRREWSYTEAAIILWGVLAAYGVALWLFYNRVIFGDALNFEHGPGSALSFTAAAWQRGELPTRGNLLLSLQTYSWATIDNLGVPLVVAAVAGIGLLCLSRRGLSEKLATLVPLSIFAFSTASLYRGESLIYTPNIWPHTFYNDRYGLLTLPAAVILACLVAQRRRRLGLVVLAGLLCLQLNSIPGVLAATHGDERVMATDASGQLAANWAKYNLPVLNGRQPITVVEPELEGAQGGSTTDEAAAWLHAQLPRGEVLISEQASGRFVFSANLSLHRFVFEGTKSQFAQALADPARSVSWIVFRPRDPRDLLDPLMQNGIPEGFSIVYDNGDYQIFQRNS